MNERVLLVDDRRENLIALEALLEPLALDLVSVTSGEEALRELLRGDFALILLDVQMPGLDGFATAELIKSRERTRHIPIIFVTAISKQDAHVFRGYSAGAVDYVFKPFHPEVLRAKVETFVDLYRIREQLRAHEEDLRRRELAEVRRSEQQRYRELAEAMPQIVWVSEADGRAVYYNERWFDYTGLDPATQRAADWRDVVHPDDLAAATKRRRETLESGAVFEVEYRFRRADGAYRWHLGRAVPVRGADGAIDHWVGTATDIDDRKRSDEVQRFLQEASTLLASSLDYRSTLASVAQLAVPRLADWCTIEMLDADGRLRELEVAHPDARKKALARELRSRYPTVLGRASGPLEAARSGEPQMVADVTPELIAEAAVDEFHRELLADLALRAYLCVPMAARDRVLGTITLVQAESGRTFTDADLALAQDLARRAAIAIDNAELFREAEERAQAARVLAAIGDGVVLVDRSGVVRLWNPAAEGITGIPDTEVIDRPLAEGLPGLAALGVAADERPVVVPVELAGREHWLSVSVVTFDDGTIYAFRDETDTRALESMRQDLVTTVSHELRTPLAAVYGAALTMQREDIELEPALRDRLMQIVIDEATRLTEIVDDLLLASQLDSGQLQVAIEACDAAALAESVVEAARTHLPPNVQLDLRRPPDLALVAADPGQLQQVLANLVENAVKYSPDGGSIVVALGTRGDHVRISVADEGLGIPAGEHRRIFEKFYRLDPNMTHGVGGTGLGLYICRELIRRVGGSIWVESKESEGSTFFVELPLAGRRAPAPERVAAA